MAKFKEETVTVRYPAEEISSLNIRSLNYAVQVTETSGSELVIQYANNRFRKFDLQQSGSGIYMEEKMAVTFYGFFRWMELLKDNVLKIEVPKGYNQTSIVVETNATGIDVREASVRNMSLTSTTGQIRVLNARFADTLTVNSESGKSSVSCLGQVRTTMWTAILSAVMWSSPSIPATLTQQKRSSCVRVFMYPKLLFHNWRLRKRENTRASHPDRCAALAGAKSMSACPSNLLHRSHSF